MSTNIVRGGLRVNRFDRWILRGRDPYRPVYLLRHERFRYAVLVMLLVWTIGQGYVLESAQHDSAHTDAVQLAITRKAADDAFRQCTQRNANAVESRKLLHDLQSVGDARERAVWKKWAKLVPATVPCKR